MNSMTSFEISFKTSFALSILTVVLGRGVTSKMKTKEKNAVRRRKKVETHVVNRENGDNIHRMTSNKLTGLCRLASVLVGNMATDYMNILCACQPLLVRSR